MVNERNLNIQESLAIIRNLEEDEPVGLLKLEVIDKGDVLGVIGNINEELSKVAEVEKNNLMELSEIIISLFEEEAMYTFLEALGSYEVAIIGLKRIGNEVNLVIAFDTMLTDIISITPEIDEEISLYLKKIEDSINKLLRCDFNKHESQLYKLLFEKKNNDWNYTDFIRTVLIPINLQKETIANILNSENYNFIINEINKNNIESDKILISFNYNGSEINDLDINMIY